MIGVTLQTLAHKADATEKPARFIWQSPESIFIYLFIFLTFIKASVYQGGRHTAR